MFSHVSTQFYYTSLEPYVYKRERVPNPTGVGRPYHVFQNWHGSGTKSKSSSQSSKEESMSENRTDRTMSSTMS